MDARSRACALTKIGEFASPLQRQLVWQGLWNECRDSRLKSTDYLALARHQLDVEQDVQLLTFILQTASAAAANYVPRRLADAENDAMFDAVLRRLRAAVAAHKASAPKSLLVTLADQAISFACTKASVRQLVPLLASFDEKFAFGQSQRWRVVVRAAAHVLDDDECLLAAELARDGSDVGLRAAATARVSRPSASVKATAWARWHSDAAYTHMSTYELNAEMGGFRHAHQTELTAPYAMPFFDEIREAYRTKSKGYHEALFSNLFPFEPENDVVRARAAKLLTELDPDADATLSRALRDEIDMLARARACRDLIGC